jgi:hypothetical protein
MYGIFLYKNFPKKSGLDRLVKKVKTEKEAIVLAIEYNRNAVYARYYWRPLEKTEV